MQCLSFGIRHIALHRSIYIECRTVSNQAKVTHVVTERNVAIRNYGKKDKQYKNVGNEKTSLFVCLSMYLCIYIFIYLFIW